MSEVGASASAGASGSEAGGGVGISTRVINFYFNPDASNSEYRDLSVNHHMRELLVKKLGPGNTRVVLQSAETAVQEKWADLWWAEVCHEGHVDFYSLDQFADDSEQAGRWMLSCSATDHRIPRHDFSWRIGRRLPAEQEPWDQFDAILLCRNLCVSQKTFEAQITVLTSEVLNLTTNLNRQMAAMRMELDYLRTRVGPPAVIPLPQ